MPLLPSAGTLRGSTVVLQYVLEPPFSLDFGLLMHDEPSAPHAHTQMINSGFGETYAGHLARFDRRFADEIAPKVPAEQIRFAQYAMSAVLGGMGYWHGSSLERDNGDEEPRKGPEASLFSAVPCRPFFPRGMAHCLFDACGLILGQVSCGTRVSTS